MAEVHEHDRVPDELATMSAQERGIWLSVERFYDRELKAEAQAAVIGYMVPAIQTVHQIALNPEARRG